MMDKAMTDEAGKTKSQDPDLTQAAASTQDAPPITGRGVFVVQVVNGGVGVRSAMLIDGDRLLEMPAIFPDVHYAMAQIDELKVLVARHFAEAAQLGTQLLAAQAQAKIHAQSVPAVKDESPQSDAPSNEVKP